MNPLSALRLAASPTLSANLMPGLPDAVMPKNLPAPDLEKLSAGSALPSIAPSGTASDTFSTYLGRMVNEVNAQQAAAGEAVNGLLTGQNVPLHQAMIAMEEASVSFQLMVEVRNKLLDSYQELMRMQI